MEKDYWGKLKDFGKLSEDYFQSVSKEERDMMQNSKSYITRLRLNKQIDFTEDFRKKFMTREYGNYAKYEQNSASTTST